MIVDVHCHLAFTGKTLCADAERFSFEPAGAAAFPGYDSYAAPRLIRSLPFQIIRWKLGLSPDLNTVGQVDSALDPIYEQHLRSADGVDALVLLAFDEYHDDSGTALGPTDSYRRRGSDIYSSNTFVRHYCRQSPRRFLFGASVHPYRKDALAALDEVVRAGAALIKWLPVHQNIDARDPRTLAFLGRAAELEVPILIHYGGEMSTANQHPDQMNPRPLLTTLRNWPKASRFPTLIIAHAATPSMPWQHGGHFMALMTALTGDLRHRPVYADISAMTNRPYWLWALARSRRWPDVHSKLVFGSDFPIPPLRLPGLTAQYPPPCAARAVSLPHSRSPSWISQALAVSRAYGFDESVFQRGGVILEKRIDAWQKIEMKSGRSDHHEVRSP